MKSGESIVGISVCFCLGTCAGEILRAYTGSAATSICAAVLPVSVSLALLAFIRGMNLGRPVPRAAIFAVMTLTGLFASVAGSFRAGGASFAPAMDAAGRLGWMIDGIPFASADTSAVLKAFLIGDRSGLGRSVVELFRGSGASHLLALSGLHVGIIWSVLSRAGAILGNSRRARVVRYVLSIGTVGFFTLMTGAGPSICRAFLFILIRETAVLFGRKAEAQGVLFAALTIQLALTPWAIRSVGFQLSYLAAGGIIRLFPSLGSVFPGKGPVKRIWDASMLSLSCQAFTAPLAWYHFGSLPRFFLICNLLAIPLTTLVIFAGIVCITLTAAGCCPAAVIWSCDFLVSLLEKTLSVISRM